ncbi:MAG: hypothetical protein AAB434_05460 [Planctomycetota bacterium]
MPIEEFSPELPPAKPNPGALWAGLVLVVVAVLGGLGIYWFVSSEQDAKAPDEGSQALDLPPPVRAPSVVEVTDEALKASADKGLTMVVTDAATRDENGICVWAGKIVLRNDGAEGLDVERPDAGNTYLELEEAGGRQVRCLQESRRAERVPLGPGASTGAEWKDEFGKGITRFRFVHVETVGEAMRVVATPWMDVPKAGR